MGLQASRAKDRLHRFNAIDVHAQGDEITAPIGELIISSLKYSLVFEEETCAQIGMSL
jgi:hypothetical protein